MGIYNRGGGGGGMIDLSWVDVSTGFNFNAGYDFKDFDAKYSAKLNLLKIYFAALKNDLIVYNTGFSSDLFSIKNAEPFRFDGPFCINITSYEPGAGGQQSPSTGAHITNFSTDSNNFVFPRSVSDVLARIGVTTGYSSGTNAVQGFEGYFIVKVKDKE